ncbi:MAG: hypothetical protein ACKO0X_08195, partial [Bacteroidota bacterium]
FLIKVILIINSCEYAKMSNSKYWYKIRLLIKDNEIFWLARLMRLAYNVPAVAAGRYKNSKRFLLPKDNQKFQSSKNLLQPASVLLRVMGRQCLYYVVCEFKAHPSSSNNRKIQ